MKYFVELPEVWTVEFLDNDPMCNGYWISSLTQSWQKGYPDNCTLPWTIYLDLARRLKLHTNKEITVDVDMLFNEPNIATIIVKELYQVGVNRVVIESKRFPKVNSLTPDSMVLSTPEEFCRLINKVKSIVPEMEVVARNEYLAMTKNLETTHKISMRAIDAGADSIVIHWGGNSETALLKKSLSKLKEKKIKTGIIPTRFLDQVINGDFENLVDFSILGNICSSYIRDSFSKKNLKQLLREPCLFKPILKRATEHEPKGKSTLIVLGAKENLQGEFELTKLEIIEKFTKILHYHKIILVVSSEAKLPQIDNPKVKIIQIENSMGEIHSLLQSVEDIHTEFTTVSYADINEEAYQFLQKPCYKTRLLFDKKDTYLGVLHIKSDILQSLIHSSTPESMILEMVGNGNLF